MIEKETYVLEQAAEIVYSRPEKHGNPEDSFATIAEFWNAYLRAGGIPDPNIQPKDVAVMMMLLKIARITEGVYDEDNYRDLAGYAENGARLDNANTD